MAGVKGSPVLRRWLRSQTADELIFDRDGVITAVRAMPCSSRGIRGYPISTAAMDEAAVMVTTEEGNQAAAQVYRALRPSVAQFGHLGRVVVASSPYGSAGWFADHWAKVDRGELAGWTAAQISTEQLNPQVPADFLADIERDEPDTFGSEHLALFESGGQAFFDMSRFAPDPMLDVAQPVDAVHWQAALDPALSSDAFGLALLGVTADSRLVVGPVEAIEPERKRGWTFELKRAARDRVLARVAELCKSYSADAVSDQHESQAIVARLSELGVNAHVVGMTREIKLAAFRELRDRLYDGSLVLPLHESLLSELARVQLKIEQGGAKILLPRSAHGHCDQVQALALCAHGMRFAAGSGEGELIVGHSSHAAEIAELDPLPHLGGSMQAGLTAGLRDMPL
jgi:hypothetical protein